MYSENGIFDTEWKYDENRPTESGIFWMPCSPGAPGAHCVTWGDLPAEQVMEPPIDMHDMERAFARNKPTVNKDDLIELDKWKDEFGQDG